LHSKGESKVENQQSEVARLLAQIDAEYEAAQRAMSGLALGTAQHAIITKRMENMARHMEKLRASVGEEAAMQLIIEWQDRTADSVQRGARL
jgi:hypothetical protein